MKHCIFCTQKELYKREQYEKTKVTAKDIAIKEGKTMYIWYNGTILNYGENLPNGKTATEILSKHR